MLLLQKHLCQLVNHSGCTVITFTFLHRRRSHSLFSTFPFPLIEAASLTVFSSPYSINKAMFSFLSSWSTQYYCHTHASLFFAMHCQRLIFNKKHFLKMSLCWAQTTVSGVETRRGLQFFLFISLFSPLRILLLHNIVVLF